MSISNKHHALFFTERGNGPDSVSLWTKPISAIVDKGEVIAERTLGLRVGPHVEHVGDERHVEPLLFARAGGYQMDEATVRALHAEFGAWLDAPRDVARASAEPVREEDGVVLLRTPAGEWGVREIIEPDPDTGEEEPQPPPDWHASEAEARYDFAHRTGNEICECCSAFVPEHEAVATMDDVHLCPTCAAGLRAEDDAKPYHCVGSGRGGDPEPPCGWTGTGAEMTHAGLCPKCDGDAEIIEPPAPAGEAPAGEAPAP